MAAEHVLLSDVLIIFLAFFLQNEFVSITFANSLPKMIYR